MSAQDTINPQNGLRERYQTPNHLVVGDEPSWISKENWDRINFCGRVCMVYPAILILQRMAQTAASNPLLFSTARELVLKAGIVGESILGVGSNIFSNIGQADIVGVGLMNLAAESLSVLIEEREIPIIRWEITPLAARSISIVVSAGIFAMAGLVPSFATGVAILVATRATQFLLHNNGVNSNRKFDLAVHFGVGYATTSALQAAFNSLPWWASSFGQLGPKLVAAVNVLNPWQIGATFALFAIVDMVAKRNLMPYLFPSGDENNSLNIKLASLTGSIITTAAIATSLGFTATVAAGGSLLVISMLAYTSFMFISNTYARIRDEDLLALSNS